MYTELELAFQAGYEDAMEKLAAPTDSLRKSMLSGVSMGRGAFHPSLSDIHRNYKRMPMRDMSKPRIPTPAELHKSDALLLAKGYLQRGPK